MSPKENYMSAHNVKILKNMETEKEITQETIVLVEIIAQEDIN